MCNVNITQLFRSFFLSETNKNMMRIGLLKKKKIPSLHYL